jgi:hypothetical protein
VASALRVGHAFFDVAGHFFGFILVICLGLIQVIWDLSEMSAHALPHVLATPPSGTSEPKDGHPDANESLSVRGLKDTL